MRIASASRIYVKRVSRDVIKACKNKGLYLYYGNTGHCIQEYTYLPPSRLEVKVFAARLDSNISLNKNRTIGVSASRIRQIEEALNELDSSDFDKE